MADFTILAIAGDNGTISPVGTVTVPAGSDQTFTINANAGYTPLVIVDAALMGNISAYVFPDVAADHSITVTFAAIGFNLTTFRESFPEFGDDTKYTDAMITFWASIATSLLNTERWGDLLSQGLMLYTAHHVVIAYANFKAEAGSGDAGFGFHAGLVSSKSVGGVSVSYNNQEVVITDGGEFNSTTYGRQFLFLARIKGIGGVQLW
jgi:hypothetical protein